jgi:hypothetical protein
MVRAFVGILVAFLVVATIVIALAYMAVTTGCRDGSRSWSHGQGTCSHHGGVARTVQ